MNAKMPEGVGKSGSSAAACPGRNPPCLAVMRKHCMRAHT